MADQLSKPTNWLLFGCKNCHGSTKCAGISTDSFPSFFEAMPGALIHTATSRRHWLASVYRGLCENYQNQSVDCQQCTVTKCFKCLCERCPANRVQYVGILSQLCLPKHDKWLSVLWGVRNKCNEWIHVHVSP